MATAGDTDIEADSTSDDIENTIICQPCEDEGEKCTAVGYCENCQEYLCKRCYDVHLIPSLTKKHKLLDKSHMTESGCINYPCQQHPARRIEYHCPTHSLLGCKLCYNQHKTSCNDVKCIQEVCEEKISSEEFVQINNELENITSKCYELQKDLRYNLKHISLNHTEVKGDIKAFKQELIDIVDKLEKDLVDKADKAKNRETEKMNILSQRIRTLVKDIQTMSARTEMLRNQDKNGNLYIELVQCKDKFRKLEGNLPAIECENQFKQFMFQANTEMRDFLMSQLSIGSLRQNQTIEKVEHVTDIYCKSGNDATNCTIIGLVFLPDQNIFVSDNAMVGLTYNTVARNTVKLIDIKQQKIVSALQLSSYPYDSCRITDTLVAVTLPEQKKINFIRIHQNLSVERAFEVKGNPYGIDYLDNKLVVSYWSPDKVEIMDMQGKVISYFDKDSNGQALFKNPYHVAINPHNKLIYVSNYSSHSVVCMQFDGKFVVTYMDNDLTNPRQVAFDSRGMVYVCAEGSHNVHQITEDCKKVKVIIPSTEGLNKPSSICYQEKEGRFLIGQMNYNSIKVYQTAY